MNEDGVLTSEQTKQLSQATERLGAELAGTFEVETIERFISETRSELEARARVTTWLPIIIERHAATDSGRWLDWRDS